MRSVRPPFLSSKIIFRQNIIRVKQEREAAEIQKKRLEERLVKFEEDARKAQEGRVTE